MSSPHPLNQAVIVEALNNLRNGQLRNCKAMGFGNQVLEALKYPAMVDMLLNASVCWCNVSVNEDVVLRLLHQVKDVEKEVATVDRMLKLGASTEIVSKFYGLTHQEIALRRDILGLPKRQGRHPALDADQDAELWRRWKTLSAERAVQTADDRSVLEVAMDLSEGMAIPLATVWNAIESWVEEGLT
jgi:hypothetical protein